MSQTLFLPQEAPIGGGETQTKQSKANLSVMGVRPVQAWQGGVAQGIPRRAEKCAKYKSSLCKPGLQQNLQPDSHPSKPIQENELDVPWGWLQLSQAV